MRRVAFHLALLLLSIAPASSARGQTITWTGNAGTGAWFSALNWNPQRVPNAQDDVLIPAGSPSITISGAAALARTLVCERPILIPAGSLIVSNDSALTSITLNSGVVRFESPTVLSGAFTLTGGSLQGAGDITINGGLNWTGGTISGAGRLILAGVSTCYGPGGPSPIEFVLNRRLENTGILWISSLAL